MSRYVVLEGTVQQSVNTDWTGREDGKLHPGQKLVLFTSVDRIDVLSPYGAGSEDAIAKMRKTTVGQTVKIQAEVKSGKAKDADPVFYFLDDLTPAK